LQLGDRRKIRFWDDKWVGDQALKLKYPRLYLLSTSKESIIDDVRERGTGENGEAFTCKLSWRREAFEW